MATPDDFGCANPKVRDDLDELVDELAWHVLQLGLTARGKDPSGRPTADAFRAQQALDQMRKAKAKWDQAAAMEERVTLVAAMTDAVAEVYKGVRQAAEKGSPMTPSAVKDDLRDALFRLGIQAVGQGELKHLALTSEQIRDKGKGGPVEAAQETVGKVADELIAHHVRMTYLQPETAPFMKVLLDRQGEPRGFRGGSSPRNYRSKRRKSAKHGRPSTRETIAFARNMIERAEGDPLARGLDERSSPAELDQDLHRAREEIASWKSRASR